MNGAAASSAVAFMASMESKMRLLLETGDTAEPSSRDEIDRKYTLAKSLITETSTYSGLARQSGMALDTLKRRLQKDGITLGKRWTPELISAIKADRQRGCGWRELELKYGADKRTLAIKVK